MANYPAPAAVANGVNPYATQAVMTAAPSTLVVRLYETAINQLRKAIRAIEASDVKTRYEANRRAFEIIEHLHCTLNLEKGGQIAGNLAQLYRFMLHRLIDVDVKNDAKAAADVITLLEPLYQSWRKLDEQLMAPKPAPSRSTNTAEPIHSVA
ncbi:MAG: flagellar export chaperone FliS [Alphaproteobacteria bacterium]